jgi:hypothetical protein
MSRMALLSSFIFAAMLPVSYFFGNSSTPTLGAAAGVMFVAYLLSGQLEARAKETKRSLSKTRERLYRQSPTMKQYRPPENRAPRVLMLPSPRRHGDASL